MEPRKAEIERSWEIVFPNDTNPHGTMFGGKLMAIMDKLAAITASRFCGKSVVTASTDAIDFKKPVRVGHRIQTLARVVWSGRTSMVVKVDVFAERTGSTECFHCTSAHFSFVALDEHDNPSPVPPLRLETDEEKQLFEVAAFVKQQAIERRKKMAE